MRSGIHFIWLTLYKIVLATLIVIGLFSTLSCNEFFSKSSKKESESEETILAELAQRGLPNDFIQFYKTFHTDSLYQMQHIVWPLRGVPTITDPNVTIDSLERFHWRPRDWKMHKLMEKSAEFSVRYDMPSDDVVTEYIEFKNLKARMMRRFARSQNGEWFLIYYADINQYDD